MSPHAPDGGGAPEDPPAPAARPRIGEALWRSPGALSTPAAAAAIGVLGAVIYALLRAASDQFYAPLGLSPEDVGLGQAELLGRALGAFLLPLWFAVLLLALWAEVVGLRAFGREVEKAQRGRFGAAVSGVASVLLLVVMIKAPSVGVALLFVPALAFGLFGLWHTSMSAGLVRVVGVVVALLAVLGAALLVFTGQSSADNVRDGRGLIGLERFALPWEASVVEVRWLGGPPPPRTELVSEPPDELPCAVLLGVHDGTAVLVDPRDDNTVRLPAGDVTLTTFTPTDDEYPVCEKTGVVWKAFDPPER